MIRDGDEANPLIGDSGLVAVKDEERRLCRVSAVPVGKGPPYGNNIATIPGVLSWEDCGMP